ncbi:neutral zinc metallopeptidase [Panacibacter sp. DH6]|uniref:Neutral zinc metallopeptidase n=1 Tax=Panacibacter microcysteis TaxID=2793269 RepID=A0A931GZQ4_9BACT|nr:neutral zinc metallopeptidase [Panacibacter microcysteis]MBG9378328.1 neutral zinc metallopeptidase [Panacibacter microcysteis]
MLWQGRRQSSNVEDRRGMGGKGLAVGGGIGTLVIAAIVYLLGGDPSAVINNAQNQQLQETTAPTKADDAAGQFAAVVLADTEDIWSALFKQMNRNYSAPTLVLFSQATQSGCGFASQASGPFYCPADSKVYVDLTFFDEMKQRFNAAGDFAQAYVIAHEVGHHVQHLLGLTDKVDAQRGRISETEMNKLSVKLELQADFLAGVWAHYEQQLKDPQLNSSVIQAGDIEEALNAANAIGDDRLQQQSQGYVVPDAFTHGTSAQRIEWFKRGFTSGDISQGDTFNDPSLN